MGKKTQVIQPNYKIMLESYIHNVKRAYGKYKKAMETYLRFSTIADDGSYVFSPSCMEAVKVAEEDYQKCMKEFNDFKTYLKVNELMQS